MNNLFLKAFNHCLKEIKKDKELLKNIEYIGLLGSVREAEAILKYSDLDILIILKTGKNGYIDFPVIESLNKINIKISKKYKDIPISFLTHSFFDFEKYVVFDYLIHYSWADIVFGNKNTFKSRINKIISSKKPSKKNIRGLVGEYLLHSRFNLFRKLASCKKDKNQIKLILDNIIEICNYQLISNNIFLDKKRDITQEFEKEFPNIEPKGFAKKSYELRKNWNKEKIPQNFIKESIIFVNNCVNNIYE